MYNEYIVINDLKQIIKSANLKKKSNIEIILENYYVKNNAKSRCVDGAI